MSTTEVAKMETWITNNLEEFEQQKVRITELLDQLALATDRSVANGIKKQVKVHQKLAVAYLQAAQNYQNTLKDL
jgi:hypothetical protein